MQKESIKADAAVNAAAVVNGGNGGNGGNVGRPAGNGRKGNGGAGTGRIVTIPTLQPAGAAYQTNFIADKDHGNVLNYGAKDLFIRYNGARTFVTAQVSRKNGNVIGVGQSSVNDEDGNAETLHLHLTDRTGNPIPKGSYILKVRGDRGTGYETGIEDEFQVI